MDRWMDGQTDRQTDRQTDSTSPSWHQITGFPNIQLLSLKQICNSCLADFSTLSYSCVEISF